eukprot:m.261841 g.261841  ORF g.261841 m.261841 type:complete len:631 (-) comp26673_c0_seq15:4335-6227(-)
MGKPTRKRVTRLVVARARGGGAADLSDTPGAAANANAVVMDPDTQQMRKQRPRQRQKLVPQKEKSKRGSSGTKKGAAARKRKSKSKKKKQGVIVDDAVPTTTLLSLPDTILIAIIHLAGPIAASRLGACCRDLHTIATHDHLWRLLWKDRANSVLARKAAREAEQESERHPDRRPRPALCTVAPWIETPIPKSGVFAAYIRLHTAKPPLPMDEVVYPEGKVEERRACRETWWHRYLAPGEMELCNQPITGDLWCRWPGCRAARCTTRCPILNRKDDCSATFRKCSFCRVVLCDECSGEEGFDDVFVRCRDCDHVSCVDCRPYYRPLTLCGSCENRTCCQEMYQIFRVGDWLKALPATEDAAISSLMCKHCAVNDAERHNQEQSDLLWRRETIEDAVQGWDRLAAITAGKPRPAPATSVDPIKYAPADVAVPADAVRPCPSCRWVFGVWDVVDAEGHHGRLSIGLARGDNGELGVSGYIWFHEGRAATPFGFVERAFDPFGDGTAMNDFALITSLERPGSEGRCRRATTSAASGCYNVHTRSATLTVEVGIPYPFCYDHVCNYGEAGELILTEVGSGDDAVLKGELTFPPRPDYYDDDDGGPPPGHIFTAHRHVAAPKPQTAEIAGRKHGV